MKIVLLLALAGGAAGLCVDVPTFLDELGQGCAAYATLASCRTAAGLTDLGLQRVLANCGLTCGSCVKANDFCEIGIGGAQTEISSALENFEIIDEPFLTDVCEWIDTPAGLRQTTNAWGNTPGENVMMGCMAIVKDSFYTDFIMEITARHDDDDASGIIFGMDPNDKSMFYKSMMNNDDFFDTPTDLVQGPFLKITKKNGKPCNGTMTPETDCYSLLGYSAREGAFTKDQFLNGRLASVDYFPNEYAAEYEDFTQHNLNAKTVTFTLIVYKGEARAYFTSAKNNIIGVWTTLPSDYAGGMVGLFMGAHQATFTSIKIADISDAATPMTNKCKFDGATCDTTVGLCLGGPTSFPTATPSSAPTFFENCQDPFRHPASEFCPNPVGGNVVVYDTSSLSSWELIDQDWGTLSEPCVWSADADGLYQSSNAWGNAAPDLMLGCMALVPDSYTDFIAEYEAVHFDNDAWGFIFGYQSPTDHYTAFTHNGKWPSVPLDGIRGPFSKIRKMNGKPCVDDMTADTFCSETLSFTNGDGFSDNGPVREYDAFRSKEYEYTHSYSADADFQAHKITIIVKDQEARVFYKSPDSDTAMPTNSLRQGQRYAAAMTFDLKGYSGGRMGIFMSAHQMIVSNFKVTDISDPLSLPSAYCGGDAGAFCDVGATGLCLAVAASGVCEGAVGPDEYDTTDLSLFDFIDDPFVNSACDWTPGPNGYLSSNGASRYEGVLLGCNAMLKPEYTDFIMEIELDNNDNDGVGFNFGWKAIDDFYRVHKINDRWPAPAADDVGMPHFKIQRRIPGTSCGGSINASNNCFMSISYVDLDGPLHEGMPADAIAPAGECGYSGTYLYYDQDSRSKMYMMVKDNQVRATFESPRSRRQVTVMNFDLSKYGYAGGRVGLWTFSHQAEFYKVTVGALSGPGAVTQFCDGDVCSERTGRCLGSPTVSPTFMPTNSPTAIPTPNVAANEYCQGAVSATAKTMVDTTDISQFLLVEHDLLTGPCAWSSAADGLTQSSTAWGNSPGDNSLMGCMAMYQPKKYTDFIAEITATHADNDGFGFVFGYNAVDDHYLGIAMNDRWPVPAADGIGGPFLKIKKHNGKPTLPNMDASTNVFDTLSHIDSKGFNRDAMQGSTGLGIPREYAAQYPYKLGAMFEETMKMVLIVTGQEARLYIPSPGSDTGGAVNSFRQSQGITSTWTFDLQGYTGGHVGVFTYAHEATFSDWTITDLTDPSAITDYCDGVASCDNQRGDASTGLCLAVPISDVCEGPVGEFVTLVDTGGVLNQDVDFEFIEDPVELTDTCTWGFGPTGHLYQSTNAYNSNTLLFGCHALVLNVTVTDFLMQVDIGNDDDDAVGFDFGWKSLDDHFKCYKQNDDWPNPSADGLPGPVMKVMRKVPGIDCANGPFNATNPPCYMTLAFVDEAGPSHLGMTPGHVAPDEYSKFYQPYNTKDSKRMVLIVRDNALRLLYADAVTGRFVGNFIFDLSPFDYTGGRVGLHVAAHQAEFSDFRIAQLSGPNATTTFCNGGECDTRTGTCLTSPTSNPTSRIGLTALPDICPGPVGGDTVKIDTEDINAFTFIDQAFLTEPCIWEVVPGVGLRQTTNAWGPSPDPIIMGTTDTGCVALIGTDQYSDFMVEVSTTHDDEDAWGFVFGYNPVDDDHFVVTVNNDKWPDPPMDGVRGPYSKFKKTTGKPCITAPMNATADNMCYDTLSYSDYLGNFVVDGEMLYDIPGEFARTYPYKVDEFWPDRKMTLIVKDGQAKVFVAGPEKDTGSFANSFRQPTQMVSMWTYALDDFGYAGGQLGLYMYAHQMTFFNLTITDLSDNANLPSAYCDGSATCLSSGACVKVPAADVCEDPVGAVVLDTQSLTPWEFFDDPAVTTSGPCEWIIEDRGNGPFLYQASNAHGRLEGVGCNALYKGNSYTDFVMQMDVDNFDNDGVGFVFGYKSELDHFKLHKRIDKWPYNSGDGVEGPNFKVMKRDGRFTCVEGMNTSNACYRAVAFVDSFGVFHQGMPDNTVAPYQYATSYFDYEIGAGRPSARSRMVLIVKDNELRTYFTTTQAPDKKVAVFANDLSAFDYDGGRVGVYMYAHQAQFIDIRVAALDGANAATEFCASGGSCNTITGLCE